MNRAGDQPTLFDIESPPCQADDGIMGSSEDDVNGGKPDEPSSAPSMPLPIQFMKVALDLVEKIGPDAFVLLIALVNAQDELFWRRGVGLYRDQVCKLCGFPITNFRRLYAARQALIDAGLIRCERLGNCDRSQTIYFAILPPDTRRQNGSPEQTTCSQNGATPEPIWRHPCSQNGATGDAKTAPHPSQNGATSLVRPIKPITYLPIKPTAPLEGEIVSDRFKLDDKPNGKPKRAKPVASQAQVEALYQLYPKHTDKPDALKAITKALTKKPYEFLKERVTAYAAARQGEDHQFTPSPARWFNREKYNEDPKLWIQRTNGHNLLATGPGQKYDPNASKIDNGLE